MKIDDRSQTSNDLRSSSVSRPVEAREDQRSQTRRPDGPTDRASISALGAQLSRALEHEPPEQVQKVERLQKAVASGTYSAPASQVSRKIVSEALRPGP